MAQNKTIKVVFTRNTYGDEGEFIAAGTVETLKDERAVYFINRGKARPFNEDDEAAEAAAKKAAKAGKGDKPAE